MSNLILNSEVNLSTRDFQGLRQAFFEYSQANFSDIWSDYNEGSFAAAIAEIVAYLGDNLHFYIDRQTQDNFLSTTKDRQAAIELAALINYFPGNPSPATGEITLSLDVGTFDYGTPLLKGFQVSNGNGIIFETNDSESILFNTANITLDVTEGETIAETTSGIGPLAIGSGSPFQSYTLSRKNVILSRTIAEINDNSELVVTVDGDLYDVTTTLSTAQSTDKVYTSRTSDSDETVITFGNGEFGVIPGDGSVIHATYRVLADEDQRALQNNGNLNIDTVIQLISSRTGVLAVSNDSPMTGGGPKESLEEIKINAPASLSALNRAVSLMDHSILAKTVTGVAKALARAGEGNFDVVIHVAPDGGGFPSTTLKNSVVAFFDDKKMAKTTIFAKDPIYQPVQISLKVFVEDTSKQSEVVIAITSAVNDLFDFDNMEFGRPVLLKSTGFDSDLFDFNEYLESVAGISKVKINKFTLKPAMYELLDSNAGTAHLSSRGTVIRNPARNYEYKIFMHTDTDYILQKGIIGNSATLNDTTITDPNLDLTLESGTSTDAGSTFLQDSNQYFQPNVFAGQTLIDSAGTFFLIASNTQDTITVTAGTPADGAYEVVERLVGYKLNPNTLRSDVFNIVANTGSSVSVASGLGAVTSAGDEYRIYRPETNQFGTNPLANTAPATTGTITSYTYGSGTLNSVTDSALAGVYADDAFNGYQYILTDGNGQYEVTTVLDYTGVSGIFTLGGPSSITTEPSASDAYICSPKYIMGSDSAVNTSLFPATSTEFESSLLIGKGDDYYNGSVVKFLTGSNEGIVRRVNDYVSATGHFTVDGLPNAPSHDDEFEVSFNYEDDAETIVFSTVIDSNGENGDEFHFNVSELVGDLIPSDIQILQIDTDTDLVINAIGGTS